MRHGDIHEGQERMTERAEVRQQVFEFLRDAVAATLLAYLLVGVVFNVVVVDGVSMNPTLNDGEVIVVQHLLYTPARGDIVVCTPTRYGTQIVKRAIGVEGDTIDIDFDTGTVFVNGTALSEDYVAAPTYASLGTQFPLTVPRGCLFVLGDNRNNSFDSRYPGIGLISLDEIRGGYLFSVIK